MLRTKFLLFLPAVAALILIGACNQFQLNELETVNVTLNTGLNPAVSRATAESVTSFRLIVSAEDIVTVEQVFTDETINLEIEAGIDRLFTLQALDADENILFSGSRTVDLTAGEPAEIVIDLGYAGFYVTFETNGGTSLPVQYVEKYGLVTIPSASVKSGYAFAGWFTDSGLTESWTLLTDTVSGDLTLYAQWFEEFMVSFESRGGSAVTPVTLALPGGYVPVPSVPTRADYTFDDWYTDNEAWTIPWNFAADTATSAMTLYAKWIDNHTDYLTLNGVDDYYTVDGLGSFLSGSDEITIECSLHPANFAADQYFLSFNGSDYSNGLQLGITTGGNLKFYNPVTAAAVDTGYALTNSNHYISLTIDSSQNVNMYFDGSNIYSGTLGGTFSVAPDVLFSIGQEWDSGPVASNYYQGYIDEVRVWDYARTASQILANVNCPPAGTESGLVAQYEFTSGNVLVDSTAGGHDLNGGTVFTVSYESNGGSAVSTQSNIPEGATTTAPTSPTKTGYSFNGWYADAGLNTVWNFATDTISSDITLYAGWTADTYSVIFNGNSSDGGSMTDQSVDFDQTISLNNNSYTRTGYTFSGWNTAGNGSGTPYSDGGNYTHTLAGIMTLYAQWTANSYSIIFDGNGATGGSMTDLPVDYDETLTLTSLGYTHSTLYFAGWNTVDVGTGTSYSDADSYTHTTDGDITLYAQWSSFTTATFTNAGAAGASGPTQAQINSAYSGTILEGAVSNPSADDGYQLWTVPVSGTYRIEARGAQGGINELAEQGANGAVMLGDLILR